MIALFAFRKHLRVLCAVSVSCRYEGETYVSLLIPLRFSLLIGTAEVTSDLAGLWLFAVREIVVVSDLYRPFDSLLRLIARQHGKRLVECDLHAICRMDIHTVIVVASRKLVKSELFSCLAQVE